MQCTQAKACRGLVIPVKLLSSSAPVPDHRCCCRNLLLRAAGAQPGQNSSDHLDSSCQSSQQRLQPDKLQLRRCSFHRPAGLSNSKDDADEDDTSTSGVIPGCQRGKSNSAYKGSCAEPDDSEGEGEASIEFEVTSDNQSANKPAAVTAPPAPAKTGKTDRQDNSGWRPLADSVSMAAPAAGRSHTHSHIASANRAVKASMYEQTQRAALMRSIQERQSREQRQSTLLRDLRAHRKQQFEPPPPTLPPPQDPWLPIHLVRDNLLRIPDRYCQTRVVSPGQWPPQSLPWPGCRIKLLVRAPEATCREMYRLREKQRGSFQHCPPGSVGRSLVGYCNSNNSNVNNFSRNDGNARCPSANSNIRSMYQLTRTLSPETLIDQLKEAVSLCAAGKIPETSDTNCSVSVSRRCLRHQRRSSGHRSGTRRDSRDSAGGGLYSLTERRRSQDCQMCRRERSGIFLRGHWARPPGVPASNCSHSGAPMFNTSSREVSTGSSGTAEVELSTFQNGPWNPQQPPVPASSADERVVVRAPWVKTESGSSSDSGSSSNLAELELLSIDIKSDSRRVRMGDTGGEDSTASSSEVAKFELSPNSGGLQCPRVLALPQSAFILRGSVRETAAAAAASRAAASAVESAASSLQELERRRRRQLRPTWGVEESMTGFGRVIAPAPAPVVPVKFAAFGRVGGGTRGGGGFSYYRYWPPNYQQQQQQQQQQTQQPQKPQKPQEQEEQPQEQQKHQLRPQASDSMRVRRKSQATQTSPRENPKCDSGGGGGDFADADGCPRMRAANDVPFGMAARGVSLQCDPFRRFDGGGKADGGAWGAVYGPRGRTTIQVLRFHSPFASTGGRHTPLDERPPRYMSQQEERDAMYSRESGLLRVALQCGNYSNSAILTEEARMALWRHRVNRMRLEG